MGLTEDRNAALRAQAHALEAIAAALRDVARAVHEAQRATRDDDFTLAPQQPASDDDAADTAT